MITRKVCLLGAFAVGKTSLVRRFVKGVFDERYLTTLGVKIDTKQVELDGDSVKLIIWDIEGADPSDGGNSAVRTRTASYLQGTDGVLLVADGTRTGTVEAAGDILRDFRRDYPDKPVVLMLNKSDLAEDWQIGRADHVGLPGLTQSFTTSALSGENVEDTFVYLARLFASNDGTDEGDN